ncbi:hypothetical protein BJY01DRAFT_242778 [Aspergillus pseudoustus]|uniref:Hydrophobin n=1 Tax=Aspergillus pseudoustus TaxID=1810923 RepID=A0ABR4KVY8_9EURO
MKFLALATLFAAAAIAMPTDCTAPSTSIEQSTTQTENTCGRAQLACCPDASSEDVSREERASLLNLLGNSDVLSNGVLGRYRGCSGLVSLQAAVGGQCNSNVACCNTGDNEFNGLINVGIPCVPINLPVL